MIPSRVEYAAPSSLAEAVGQLAGTGAQVLAGGQGLLPSLRTGTASAALLVDLRNIPDLGDIAISGAGVTIGAMVTLDELAAAQPILATESALTDSLRAFGDPQVRNRATVGGALAHRHQGVDLPAVAVAMGATVALFGREGAHHASAEELLGSDASLPSAEVITALQLPPVGPGAGSAYEKVRDPGSSYAICAVAASVVLGDDGTIQSARLAVAGASTPAGRLPNVEAALAGQPASAASFAASAGHLTGEGLSFPSDVAAPGEYRAHLAQVLIPRALARATDRARKVSA